MKITFHEYDIMNQNLVGPDAHFHYHQAYSPTPQKLHEVLASSAFVFYSTMQLESLLLDNHLHLAQDELQLAADEVAAGMK